MSRDKRPRLESGQLLSSYPVTRLETVEQVENAIPDILIRFGTKEIWDLAAQLCVSEELVAQACQNLLDKGKIRIAGELSDRYCCVILISERL